MCVGECFLSFCYLYVAIAPCARCQQWFLRVNLCCLIFIKMLSVCKYKNNFVTLHTKR